MSTVQEYAFQYVYGDSFTFTVTWNDSSGTARDITGYTADMKVRDRSSGAELLALSIGSGLSIATGTDGKVTCSATPTIMKAGSLTNVDTIHDYDLQVRSSDGSILRTLLRGDFQVLKEFTDVDS